MVVGLDGATFDLIEPWVKEGKLPTFQRLMAEGCWGKLESVPNQRSAAAWTSLATGTNPGKHGIYEFYEQRPDSYDIQFINASIRHGKSLWKTLSEHDRRVGVLNVPMTYPAERVNRFLVAGIDAPSAHSKGFAYPPEIYEYLCEKFGPYVIEPGVNGFVIKGEIDKAVESLRAEIKQKSDITQYLLNNEPWDFFIVVFRSLDAAQHGFWKYLDPKGRELDPVGSKKYGDVILKTYQQLDEAINAICNCLDRQTRLIIISDHGFGRKHPASNQLNYWLEDNGFLAFKSKPNKGLSPASLLQLLYRYVSKKTSRATKERLKQLLPWLRNRVHSHLVYARIDWSKTRAYSDNLFPIVRVNMRGREPQGIVGGGAEYEGVVAELKERLPDCRDSVDSVPIVDSVFHRDEIYRGPFADRAPDLLIRWREDIEIHGIALSKNAGEIAGPPVPTEDARYISGDHRLHGILIAAGDGIKQDARISGACLIDIAPTVLNMMGVPAPADMDGKILKDLFEEPVSELAPAESSTLGDDSSDAETDIDYTEEDEETIRKRLEGLGYL